MTAILFVYPGYVDIDGQKILKAPYIGRAVLSPGSLSDAAAATSSAKVAAIWLPAGEATYEVIPEGHPERTADEHSVPLAVGWNYVNFGPGWQVTIWQRPHPILTEASVMAFEKSDIVRNVQPAGSDWMAK